VFRWLETVVPKQPWYEGGYRANIVTYAMAKVFHDANGEKQVIDLDAIWRRQSVPDALQRALLLAAAEAHDVITDPPAGVRNMSEWAKQQACWNGMKGRTLNYDDDFDSCLTLVETARSAGRDEKAQRAMIEGINAQSEVVTLGPDFWREVLAWGRERKRLTPKDLQILEIWPPCRAVLPPTCSRVTRSVRLDACAIRGLRACSRHPDALPRQASSDFGARRGGFDGMRHGHRGGGRNPPAMQKIVAAGRIQP